MATDIQVMFPLDEVPLQTMRAVVVDGVAKLDLTGADFSSVKSVYINEDLTEDFVVYSKNRMLVTLPETVAITDPIDSVQVLSRRFTLTDTSVLKFEVKEGASLCRGLFMLVQLFTKILLTTPGTNCFNKTQGGGLLKYLSGTFGRGQISGIVSGAVICVDRTEKYLIRTQARSTILSLNERLRSAKLVGHRFDTNTGSLSLIIEVVSQSGRVGRANLEV